ncbi:MAG: MBL fold metallo-hydrolase [Pseudomonadota bacterium]
MDEAELAPKSIDYVVITHCHGDHIGGLLDDGGQLVFSKARHCIGMTEVA